MSQDCPQLKYLFKFVLLLSCLIFITPANALGKIEQTYVGGNDATELVRAFNAWVDENDGESWSKVLVKEFPGIVFSSISLSFTTTTTTTTTTKYIKILHSVSTRSRGERIDRGGRRLHLDSLEIGYFGRQNGGIKTCKILFEARERLQF